MNGFGGFHVADRKARIAQNPKTGENMKVKAGKVPVFKAGSNLRNIVKSRNTI